MPKLSRPNPFIVVPGEFWADRRHLWEDITNRVEIARRTRSNEIIVLVGDYGCGTTHTLKYLRNFLQQRGAFVSFVTTPVRADMSSLFESFLEALGPEQSKPIISDFIDEYVSPDALERSKVPPEIIEKAFTSLISGRRLSFRYSRVIEDLGIPEKISPMEVWGRVIAQIATEEMPAFILIDEFDAALLEPLSSTSLLYGLARLYDETLCGLCMIIALKGEPKDVRAKLGDALYSRMSLQPIYMAPLSKDDVVDFVKDIFEYKYGKKRRPGIPLFSEEAIKTLAELACPCTPRRLLKVCSVIFEEAFREEVRIPIDKEFVFRIGMRFGEISLKAPEKTPESKAVSIIPVISAHRGGKRGPVIWSSAIDSLIQEEFFKLPNRRETADVATALVNKGLPATRKHVEIINALIRKVRQGKIKGTKTPKGWTFWTE